MFNKQTVRDINFSGKTVLVRVDFNVPVQDGKVMDDTRIIAALPTIEYLIEQDAALILCSHLGRPKGKKIDDLSLKPVADYLDSLLESDVIFSEETIGPVAKGYADKLKPGQVLILENTRFNPGEKGNDPEFANQLSSLADILVNDAFGTAHRAHASNVGAADYLPAVSGFLLEKEIKYLGQVIEKPEKPFVAILGGAKISDKIGVIEHLLTKADNVLIGGGMANTFFKAQGYPIGDSLVEDDALEKAREILASADTKLRLPVDIVIADEFSNDSESRTISMGPIPDGWRILDIGPETVKNYGKTIKQAKTVVWNGPMGVFEFSNFAKGTFALAEAIASSECQSIIGGGDSAAAIKQSGLADQVTHISTGGGASLEMLEGKVLPGLDALLDK